jgi:hypothetical protein
MIKIIHFNTTFSPLLFGPKPGEGKDDGTVRMLSLYPISSFTLLMS